MFSCNEIRGLKRDKIIFIDDYFSQPFPEPFPKFATVPNIVSTEFIIFGVWNYN